MKSNKKVILILLCIIAVLLCMNSLLSYRVFLLKGLVIPTDFSESTFTQLYDFDASVPEAAYILDNAYKEKMAAAQSNFEMSSINSEFAQKWDELANQYYNEVLKLVGEEAKQNLIESQTLWETYAESRINLQSSCLYEAFRGGTIVPVKCSEFQYKLYRSRAAEMYMIYMNLDGPPGGVPTLDELE